MTHDLRKRIFSIGTATDFDELALEIFSYQSVHNPVYRNFISGLGISTSSIQIPGEIPFLPIEFFRNHMVLTGSDEYTIVFESSGSTGALASRHFIRDIGLYEESFLAAFRHFFGDPHEYFFAALLPSYEERSNSSLVFMVDKLIKLSCDRRSGYFTGTPEKLIYTLQKIREEGGKGMVIGVSFALLDMAERFSANLSGIVFTETGGMKGRRKEITRHELHSVICKSFGLRSVHSEYGMTELLSQAWSAGNGIFSCPPWMRVRLREINDPLTVFDEPGITGGINIIDLANINSCSFIATGDLGRLHHGGAFEVLGRFDTGDIRGCNLLVE